MAQGSVLGRSTIVRGNVRGTGALEIHGRVEGDVSVTGELVIGEDGSVKGDVTGAHVTVAGAVQGDVRATEAVMLESGGRVVGDLSAPRIGVSPGALVRGSLRTEGEPFPGAVARRPAPAAIRGPAMFATRGVQAEAPIPLEEPEAPAENPTRGMRDAPPPPVVPALAKGARAKKKKKE